MAQSGLRFLILKGILPEYLDFRCGPPHHASVVCLNARSQSISSKRKETFNHGREISGINVCKISYSIYKHTVSTFLIR